MMNKIITVDFNTFVCVICGRLKGDRAGKLWETGNPGTYEFICHKCEADIFEEMEIEGI